MQALHTLVLPHACMRTTGGGSKSLYSTSPERDQLPGLQSMLSLKSTCDSERPTRSTLSLAFDGGHRTLGPPVHSVGEVGCVEGDHASAPSFVPVLQVPHVAFVQLAKLISTLWANIIHTPSAHHRQDTQQWQIHRL